MALGLDLAEPEVTESITEFLLLESLALDERRFRDWLEAFSDDARYEVPLRVTREKLAEWELSPTSRIFHDTKRTLEFRVERLETDFAWSEQPPSRTRHYISNVLVEKLDGGGDYLARSNCLIYRSRGEDPIPTIISAQRKDRIRKDGAEWKIVHRWAALDQSLVNAHNLSIFI